VRLELNLLQKRPRKIPNFEKTTDLARGQIKNVQNAQFSGKIAKSVENDTKTDISRRIWFFVFIHLRRIKLFVYFLVHHFYLRQAWCQQVIDQYYVAIMQANTSP
jgi:hypothetical protein